MVRFVVYATKTTQVAYTVQADSAAHAIELVNDGNWVKETTLSTVSIEPDNAEEAPDG